MIMIMIMIAHQIEYITQISNSRINTRESKLPATTLEGIVNNMYG